MMPDSRWRAYWDVLNLTLMTWTVFEIPYTMLFADTMKVKSIKNTKNVTL